MTLFHHFNNRDNQKLKSLALLLFSLSVFSLLIYIMYDDMFFTRDSIYWGARIKGDTYSMLDAPWDPATIDIFEAHAQKRLSILNWGQPWWHCYSSCGYQQFQDQVAQYDMVRGRGTIPFVDWASWDYAVNPQYDQPNFSLSTIINGEHDDYIRRWAGDAKRWGHPFFLRFNWEMNGTWYPWSEAKNGNGSGQFVRAWRHVHDIFTGVGATNVTWVWCPVADYPGSIALESLYPGDAYVDWTCIDGYNWGVNPVKPDRWKSFREIFEPTYGKLLRIAPDKPIIIAETSSTEIGGSKANWIEDVLKTQLPAHFPRIQALLWFNWNDVNMDWVIETSPAAQAAFADGIASSYYAANDFANLDISPIPPLNRLQ